MVKQKGIRVGKINKAIDNGLHRHFNGPYAPLAFTLDSALHAAAELCAGVPPQKVFEKWVRFNWRKMLRNV